MHKDDHTEGINEHTMNGVHRLDNAYMYTISASCQQKYNDNEYDGQKRMHTTDT